MPDWSRRELFATLGVAGAAALAGCDARRPPSTAVELAVRPQVREDLLDSWSPSGPRAREQGEALDAAIAGERYVTSGYPPIPADELLERDGPPPARPPRRHPAPRRGRERPRPGEPPLRVRRRPLRL